jgi:hypothetical protein
VKERSNNVASNTGSMRCTDPKDSTRRYFRSADRYVCVDGSWYFSTREGDCGPFPTKKVAVREMERYLAECRALTRFQTARERRLALGPRAMLDFALVPMD